MMSIDELKKKAAWLRREAFEMVVRAKKGHYPSSSSCTEIVVALYYGGFLRYDARNPRNPDRDRLFISKGHAGMVLYPILEELGFVPKGELLKFTKADGIFRTDPGYCLNSRERKHRLMLKLERLFGFRFNKKHYRLVR